MDDILYVQVVNRKIEVVTKSKVYKGKLIPQLELILKQFGFERLHQSKIVNMSKIMDFDKNAVYFDYEKTLVCPVTRRNRIKVAEHFKKI